MDSTERLKLLFQGADEGLLSVDVGLREQEQQQDTQKKQEKQEKQDMDKKQQNGSANAASAPSLEPGCTMPSSTQDWNNTTDVNDPVESDDELFNDEYLGSFARASKPKTTSKKKAATQDRNYMESVDVNYDNGFDQAGSDFLPPESGAPIQHFCPIIAISRFPYKYVHGPEKNSIAAEFFDAGKFWNRAWDIYYIHPPACISTKPIILIPTSQVQVLIDQINSKFETMLAIPADKHLGVLLPFVEDGTPQPQYLGRSKSRETKDNLERSIPVPLEYPTKPAGSSQALDRSFSAFKAKMEAAINATRRKNNAAKGKRQRTQAQKIQAWNRGLKRAQCYLGLRPRLPRGIQQSEINGSTPWEQEQEQQETNGAFLDPLDLEESAPCLFVDEPIFVCVDVESNEKHHEQITEIGVSTLDTLDLTAIAPGEGGCNWLSKIRSRHFRISEFSTVTNSEFVHGCPDRFEFGESEWVTIGNAARVIDSCFQPPYSANIGYHGTTRSARNLDPSKAKAKDAELDATAPLDYEEEEEEEEEEEDAADGGVKLPHEELDNASTPDTCGQFNNDRSPRGSIKAYKKMQRNLILVGHDVASDITYLRKLGCTALNPPSSSNPTNSENATGHPKFLESIDTSTMFRILKRDTQASSLAKVLIDLGITGWHLHNAGNDARYTLESMVGIAIKSRLEADQPADATENSAPESTAGTAAGVESTSGTQEDGDKKPNVAWQAEIERRISNSQRESESRIREECAMWEAALGRKGDWDIPSDDIDGGFPSGLVLDN